MGTDIHAFFEKVGDQGWEPLYSLKPRDESYYRWYEDMVSERVRNGSIFVLIGKEDEEAAYEYGNAYFENFKNPQEIMERFGDDPHILVDWGIPSLVTSRSYEWFTALSNIRGWLDGEDGDGAFGGRGFPDDACRWLVRERDRWKGDGHSHSWALVSDIIAHPKLQRFRQTEWMRQTITEPEKTRMVFWYDN